MALFQLGSVVATPAALRHCNKHNVNPLELFRRHQSGDYGQLTQEDIQANTDAIAFEGRILSAYMIAGVKLYVTTEWDRSYSTLMLASEY